MMDGRFEHVPVLLEESITGLNIKKDGVYADGTAGGGNHSLRIGQSLSCLLYTSDAADEL